MSSEKQISEMINELRFIEAHCQTIEQRCYKARVKLEKLSSPAPSRGKRALTVEQENQLRANIRKSIIK